MLQFFSKKGLLFLLLCSLVFNGVFVLRDYKKQDTSDSGVFVQGIIDGDTIVVDQKTRIRLRHIDAPEKNLCGYQQAVDTLSTLVVGKRVRIQEVLPDQYGRGMALVYVDTTLINEALLDSGWVRYHSDSSSQTDRLKKASQRAKDEKRGVYSLCQSYTHEKNPSCMIKGNIDKNKSKDNKKYYLPTCAQYQFTLVEEDTGEQWFCTEQDAKTAGFRKADTCK